MIFGPAPVDGTEGTILAHSIGLAKGRLRKGRLITADDIATLRAEGIDTITVARLEPGDVHEDVAAERLAQSLVGAAAGKTLRLGVAATGRVNIHAVVAGLAALDVAAVHAANAVDPMITIATVPQWQRLAPGDMAATVKIISYAVPEAALDLASSRAAQALVLRPVERRSAALIQTVVPGDDGATGHKAIAARLGALGIALPPKTIVPHDTQALAQAIAASPAEVILILTGSATSDPQDTAPAALRAAGGQVIHFGMPVDPGNLLFLGDLQGKPVIGLPGCARSAALNGADWVLERVLCGVPVTSADIAGMGVGGLLKEIPTRPRPREV